MNSNWFDSDRQESRLLTQQEDYSALWGVLMLLVTAAIIVGFASCEYLFCPAHGVLAL